MPDVSCKYMYDASARTTIAQEPHGRDAVRHCEGIVWSLYGTARYDFEYPKSTSRAPYDYPAVSLLLIFNLTGTAGTPCGDRRIILPYPKHKLQNSCRKCDYYTRIPQILMISGNLTNLLTFAAGRNF